ncbi:MAG: AGE family epimerase/isomerase [Mucilaginibacter sp.]
MDRALLLSGLKNELSAQLADILSYWITHTIDEHNGGFVGKINNYNEVDYTAPKGSVLNARILWAFSAAYSLNGNEEYLSAATRAYQYIARYFIDEEFGGIYWTVDYKGEKLDTKKQVYATAFTIYGLSEYYKATKLAAVKDKAIQLYQDLINHGYDCVSTGYFEAFTRNWDVLDDLRLSRKDANEKKTMNTHLHVVEAFGNLYTIWPDSSLKFQIEGLLRNFSDHFIDPASHRLNLFFDENWQSRSSLISYGHDIEASWLLLECAIIVGEDKLIKQFSALAVAMTEEVTEGLDADGGLWYEFNPVQNQLVKEKHWWVQAEALVGFYNAWQLSRDETYLNMVLKNWKFIKDKILDKTHGEWYWGINGNGKVMRAEDKVGIWKCPYHNSRACIEIIRRIG